MRALVACLMVLGIALSPAIARPTGTGDKAAGANSEGTANPAVSSKSGSDPSAASSGEVPTKPKEPSMESELQELRDLIEAQSKQIQAQSEQLREQQQQMQTLQEQMKSSAGASSLRPWLSHPRHLRPRQLIPVVPVFLHRPWP